MSLSFFAEKVILELKCTKSLFRASKNTILCFSANKHNYENARPQMLKNFFLSEKKLLHAILRAKLKLHEKCFFLMK